ncbi:MAG: hypothetical protein ACTSYI_07725, partial [Promethearchaeota archaeon]
MSLNNLPTSLAQTVTEDGFEENDSFLQAKEIIPNTYANLCLDDEDWYNFTAQQAEKIFIQAEFDNASTNLNMELFNASYEFIMGSYTIFDNETIEFINKQSGLLYLRVYSVSGYVLEGYNLTLQISPFGTYDDKFEPNNDIMSAVELTLGFYPDLIHRDFDWYKIWVDYEYELEIIMPANLSILMNISVYDESYTYFDMSSFNLTLERHEYIWQNWDVGQWVYISINIHPSFNFYTLNISATYIDDEFEENDSPEGASAISPGNNSGLVQNDDDWYKIWLAHEDEIVIDLYYDNSSTWMDMT